MNVPVGVECIGHAEKSGSNDEIGRDFHNPGRGRMENTAQDNLISDNEGRPKDTKTGQYGSAFCDCAEQMVVYFK